MTTGKTSSGFAYEFDEKAANDMRVLVLICELVDEKANLLKKAKALVDLPILLLGKAQTDALYEHLSSLHEGRVPPTDLEKELTEIMSGSAGIKK